MTAHRHQCIQCDPDLAPTLDRQGNHHIGVRFGTHRPQRQWEITLNGVAIPYVVEALAGRKGWIVALTVLPDEKGPHICRTCNKGVCADRLEGLVEISVDGTPLSPPGS